MTVDEIRKNIRYNENLIEQLSVEKCKLQTQIDELEQLQNKFSTLQNNFVFKQEQRKQGLTNFSQITVGNKIFSSYFDGMTSLLDGSDFKSAFAGLSTAKQRINAKMQSLLEEIFECEEKIVYRKNREDYWQEQLRLAIAEVNN